MRLCLFTDTLADVNGVSRFIQNVALKANQQRRQLHVITSTAFTTPNWSNIHNLQPIARRTMPRYAQLEIVLPPVARMLRLTRRLQPDVIHISTPGPVGCTGRWIARRLGVPLLGVYHTDFSAYIDHLFDDRAFTWATTQFMRSFYRPFATVFARSEDYARSLAKLGFNEHRIARLQPGIETSQFSPRFCDNTLWEHLAHVDQSLNTLARPAVRFLSVGRVSVEKNLPMLTRVWTQAHQQLSAQGVEAKLLVVGDGPYRATMQRELEGKDALFLGFRHGRELSSIYASSDCFIFPSTTDTLGQVVMEAQSSGLPVIVTDQGGPKEVVEHTRTGFVLKADDEHAWTDTIVHLAQDKAKRKAMGNAASGFMQYYDIEHSFEHFWSVHVQAHGRVVQRAKEKTPRDSHPSSSPVHIF